jgi:DNA primase
MLEPNNGETAFEREAAEKAHPLFARQAERLRQEVPIAKVIGEYTKLRRTKKRLVGYCPLHEESKPTLRVDPRTNTFQCSGCGVSGDAIRFLQEVEYLTFGQALETLEKIRYADDYADVA